MKQLEKEGKPATDEDVAKRAYNNASSQYGTGSVIQRGIQGATGALTALAGGGNPAGALAAATAPELANLIGHGPVKLNDDERLIAHALLGGAVAALQGNNVAEGATGALSGELAARVIMEQLYPGKNARDLSESDKQLVCNLATIAAGFAGNLAGEDSSSTIAGAQAGKNAAENNEIAMPLPPTPVPGVPVSPGDAVAREANNTIASAVDSKLKDISDAFDKATQCKFGRACSSDDTN